MIKQCQTCEQDFVTYQSKILQGKGKFCSRKCSEHGKKIESSCLICNKLFTTHKCKIESGRGKFCSRKCYETDWSKRIPGWNKGTPATWAIGNQYRKGIPNLNPNKMYGEDNPKWKGDNVGYEGLHLWVYRELGRPDKCEHCGVDNLHGHDIHWANKSGKYLRDTNDWLRLCPKCHKKYDS